MARRCGGSCLQPLCTTINFPERHLPTTTIKFSTCRHANLYAMYKLQHKMTLVVMPALIWFSGKVSPENYSYIRASVTQNFNLHSTMSVIRIDPAFRGWSQSLSSPSGSRVADIQSRGSSFPHPAFLLG